jgi:hypothetical protein
MSDSSKKASAVLFTILVLVAVGAWITLTLDRELKYAVRVHDVELDAGLVERRLLSEEIIQGTQFLRPELDEDRGKPDRDFSRLPTAYWHPRGPVGEVFAGFDWFRGMENTWRGDARLPASLVGHGGAPLAPLGQLAAVWSEPPIGVVQMKTGAIAGYTRPYQVIDFYEANPAIIALSRPEGGEPTFSYLRDAEERGARVRVFEGPEIESLREKGPRWFYRLLIVETGRHGTATAEELITDAAFDAYLRALDEHGLLVVHVSSADRDFRTKLAQTAKEFGLAARLAEDPGNPPRGPYPSDWLVLSPRAEALGRLRTRGPAARLRWSPPRAE